MPELPEVENTRRYLVEAGLPGRTFTGADIGWARTVKNPTLEEFVLGLPGSRVKAIQRRAKYLLLPLDTGSTLIFHLGMAGGLVIQPKSQPSHPMVRHCFSLDDGRELRFLDPRKFAKIWLAADSSVVLPPLGPEPLSEGFTSKALAARLGSRKVPIKALLLEQSVTAGLGNLYADESLYLAGIHPWRLAAELSDSQIACLQAAIVKVLTSALAQYDQGRADPSLEPPLKLMTWTIPRRLGASCLRCDGPISSIRIRGRNTYFCPQCQG
jgi:formamidopyrimidine-DNA glycosylase